MRDRYFRKFFTEKHWENPSIIIRLEGVIVLWKFKLRSVGNIALKTFNSERGVAEVHPGTHRDSCNQILYEEKYSKFHSLCVLGQQSTAGTPLYYAQ